MDIKKLMKQAQTMQKKMQDMQEEIAKKEFEGKSGGGLVSVKATAKGRILGVSIDDSLMKPEEKGILEDLVAAAFNDARDKADAVSGEEMGKMTSGMQLPPGFKLPF